MRIGLIAGLLVATACAVSCGGTNTNTDAGTSDGDTGRCTTPDLAPPPAGQGIQLKVTFTVPAGTEQQKCWAFHLPSTTDLEVVKYEVAYNVGSHHMNLFRMLPSVAAAAPAAVQHDEPLDGNGHDCFNAVDFDHYDLVVGAQTGNVNWSLPEHVAYRIHANSPMLLQSHFVNGATQATPCERAEVRVNLWTAPDASTITQHLGTMFANNRAINIPAHSTGVAFNASCTVPVASTFVAMTGHFHSRGKQFTAFETDDGHTPGAQCYQSNAWAEPPFEILDGAGLSVPAGGGLSYRCVFDNDTDVPITFGPHVEYEEHCNLFAYYYPVDPDSRARYCF